MVYTLLYCGQNGVELTEWQKRAFEVKIVSAGKENGRNIK